MDLHEFYANRTKRRLANGELTLCMGVNQMRTPNIGMIAHSAGFDAIYVDLEHNPTDLETMAGMCIGAIGAGITPIVRVAGPDRTTISRVLDVGAQGVMVAHVNTAEEARAVVEAGLFKPMGRRSAAGPLASMGYMPMSQHEVNLYLNAHALIIPMIETEEGLANVEAIAAVPGIDMLHIGAHDLSVELDLPGQLEHPSMLDAYSRVAAAAHANGIALGIGATSGRRALQAQLLDLGARYLTCGIDVSLVTVGGLAETAAVRSLHLNDKPAWLPSEIKQ